MLPVSDAREVCKDSFAANGATKQNNLKNNKNESFSFFYNVI